MTQPDTTGTDRDVSRTPRQWGRGLRNAPPWLERFGSLVAAVLLVVAAVRWGYLALELTDPCGNFSSGVCDEPHAILQGLQLVLAIAGIGVAVLLAALTLYQTATGRRAPWVRTTVVVLVVLALAWGVVFVVGWASLGVVRFLR